MRLRFVYFGRVQSPTKMADFDPLLLRPVVTSTRCYGTEQRRLEFAGTISNIVPVQIRQVSGKGKLRGVNPRGRGPIGFREISHSSTDTRTVKTSDTSPTDPARKT